ncbi:MAG: S1-like domain-containing RNA-binding protein [Kofleriaceae bacterium]
MTIDLVLGRRVTLPIRRLAAAGAFLAIDDDDRGDTVLLPAREVAAGRAVGDDVDVFVHHDSEQRPIATTRMPRLALGEVAFLEVTATTEVGAFVDWGLGKELLVPFAQQSRELHVGERHPIGLYIDKSGRLAGTMAVGELLAEPPRRYQVGEWLDGVAWRNDPDIGLFVIVERRFVGLVPAAEPHRLRRGEATRARVTDVLPGGKIVLSLRQLAHQELAGDAARIRALLARPGAPRLGDHSSPERIREVLGLSKKAFKRAAGRLLKEGAARIDDDGYLTLVTPAVDG